MTGFDDSLESAPLDTIYTRYHRELWAQFYAFCSDPERASDAVQESFLRLQRQEPGHIRNPKSWLLHVGKNWLRDRGLKKESSRLTDDQLNMISDEARCPDEVLCREELNQWIRLGLTHLREVDRLCLVLRYGMQWQTARIAEFIESTPAATYMRLSRARRKLSRILTDQHPELEEQMTM